MTAAYDDAQKFGREQMDRALASLTAFSKGIQAIAVEVGDLHQKSFSESSTAVEKLFAARSLERAVEVQQEIVRESYDTFVSRAARLGEMYVELARDTCRPYEDLMKTPRP